MRCIILSLLTVWSCSNAYARQDGEKNKLEAVGFIGAKMSPLKDAYMYGVESEVGMRILPRTFLGFCGDRTQGRTKNNFGFPSIPWHHHLTSNSFSLDLKLQVIRGSDLAVFMECSAGLESIQLGGELLYSVFPQDNMSIINHYKTVSRNRYSTLRPGIEFYVFGRMIVKANYDFLTGETNFGKRSDFEGFQLTMQVTIRKKHKYLPEGYFYHYVY